MAVCSSFNKTQDALCIFFNFSIILFISTSEFLSADVLVSCLSVHGNLAEKKQLITPEIPAFTNITSFQREPGIHAPISSSEVARLKLSALLKTQIQR